MNQWIITLWALLLNLSAYAQIHSWNIRLEEKNVQGWNGAQSFSSAQFNGAMLLLGGRTDGLHLRHPFSAFLVSEANHVVSVLDPTGLQYWSMPVDSLPPGVQEQFLSTNMQSVQIDSMLYLLGGYGYMASLNTHGTHGRITAVHVPHLVAAIQQGNVAAAGAAIRSWEDARFAWTGGAALELQGVVYMAGGHFFQGLYNPMGPTHGPGFSQSYHEGYIHFELVDDGDSLEVINFTSVSNPALMHRRDFNMAHRRDPLTGAHGLTAFSGVFQPNANLPWHDLVDLDASGLAQRTGASQLLNQYHGAHFGMWDSVQGTMTTLFLGGIGEYLVQSDGSLVQDPNVPFTKHISAMVETASGTSEYYLGEMPDFLGAGAVFFPDHPAISSGIVDLTSLPSSPVDSVRIGFMVGGIRSTGPNIFFSNGANLSTSNAQVYEIWLDRSGLDLITEVLPQRWVRFDAEGQLRLGGGVDAWTDLWIYDATGRQVYQGRPHAFDGGLAVPASKAWPPGTYIVRLENGDALRSIK